MSLSKRTESSWLARPCCWAIMGCDCQVLIGLLCSSSIRQRIDARALKGFELPPGAMVARIGMAMSIGWMVSWVVSSTGNRFGQ